MAERSPGDRFSTTSARLRALGRQAQAQVYRASGRRPPVPPKRSRFTGRAAVLVLVLCALVVALAYPTRQYIAQRSDIAEQREKAEQARKRVERLREEKARWQDPEHVKAEAREHLHFVLPGETAYTIVDPDVGTDVPRSSARKARKGAGHPWYENLWAGIDEADHPSARPAAERPAAQAPGHRTAD